MSVVPIGSEDPDLGGKANGLAVAMKAGLAVPPGVVVPAARFRAALAEVGGLPDEPDDGLLADRAARLARVDLDVPALGGGPWIVRSSATVEDRAGSAAPGIFRSRRDVDGAGVPAAIRDVWASLLSPTAAAYLGLRRIRWRDAAMAVIVQEQAAGVRATAYSRAPGDPDHVLVEAEGDGGRALVGQGIAGSV